MVNETNDLEQKDRTLESNNAANDSNIFDDTIKTHLSDEDAYSNFGSDADDFDLELDLGEDEGHTPIRLTIELYTSGDCHSLNDDDCQARVRLANGLIFSQLVLAWMAPLDPIIGLIFAQSISSPSFSLPSFGLVYACAAGKNLLEQEYFSS